MSEVIDRRVLGALTFVDVNTGLAVQRPLRLTSEGATFYRNRSGLYVILRADGFGDYIRTFENPPVVSPAAFSVEVVDPSGRYLPRETTVDLPRDPDPANSANPDSLFRAQEIPLYLSPAAAPAAGWGVIYASVRAAGTEEPLGGALLRVIQNGTTVLARGLTAWQGRIGGEGIVAVPGLPVTISGDDGDEDGLVIVEEISLTLEAIVDPAFDPATAIPDPADLEARRDTLSVGTTPIGLASGRTITATVEVTV